MSDFDADSDNADHDTDEQLALNFSRAAEHVQSMHATYTSDQLLELYALYKQANVGPCNDQKPNVFSVQARAKWSAWQQLGTMPAAEAKRLYIAKLTQIDKQWSCGTQQQKNSGLYNWVVHSVHCKSDTELNIPETEKTCFDYVKENNLEKLRNAALTIQQLQQLDENGLGLLHWATDRNAVDIVGFLLKSGADVNLQDAEGQAALHYAASCAHYDCLHLLLQYNADKSLRDNDGQTAADVADDPEIQKILVN